MTHCDQGTLQAYADGELRGAEGQGVTRHLETCAQCREALAGLRGEAQWALARLRALAPEPEAPVDAEGAWRRLRAVWNAGAGRGGARAGAWGTAAAALAAVAIATTTISPLRAMAAGVLQVFRPQQVQIVTVSSADLQEIGAALATAAGPSTANLSKLAQVRVDPSGQPAQRSLAQARAELGFDLTTPGALPGGYALSSVWVEPAVRVQVANVQVGQINGILAAVGDPVRLPGAVAGATFVVAEPASALLTYTSAGGTPIQIGEAQTPTLEVPADVDMAQVRQALLQLPFLPAGLRTQLEAVTNWQSTAVVPQVSGLTQGVTVGNAQGIFVTPPVPGKPATLAWIQRGVVRAVRGDLTQAQANRIAHGMS